MSNYATLISQIRQEADRIATKSGIGTASDPTVAPPAKIDPPSFTSFSKQANYDALDYTGKKALQDQWLSVHGPKWEELGSSPAEDLAKAFPLTPPKPPGMLERIGAALAPQPFKSVLDTAAPGAPASDRLKFGTGPISTKTLDAANAVASGQAQTTDPTVARTAQGIVDTGTTNLGDLAQSAERGKAGALRDKAAEFRSPVEFVKDFYVDLGAGLTQLASAPVNLFAPDSPLAAKMAKDLQGIEDQRSDIMQARKQLFAEKIKNEDGFLNKYGTTVMELVTNPSLAISEITKQLPNIAAIVGTGGLGGLAGRGLVAGASRLSPAVALSDAILAGGITARAATAGATTAGAGASAVLTGGDAAGEVYKELLKVGQTVWEKNPDYQELVAAGKSPKEAIKELAAAKAKMTGLLVAPLGLLGFAGAEASLVSKGVAKTLGQATSKGGAAKLFLKDNLGEQLEEGGTQFGANVGIRTVDESRALTEGVAQAAGTAAVASAPFGAAAAISSNAGTGGTGVTPRTLGKAAAPPTPGTDGIPPAGGVPSPAPARAPSQEENAAFGQLPEYLQEAANDYAATVLENADPRLLLEARRGLIESGVPETVLDNLVDKARKATPTAGAMFGSYNPAETGSAPGTEAPARLLSTIIEEGKPVTLANAYQVAQTHEAGYSQWSDSASPNGARRAPEEFIEGTVDNLLATAILEGVELDPVSKARGLRRLQEWEAATTNQESRTQLGDRTLPDGKGLMPESTFQNLQAPTLEMDALVGSVVNYGPNNTGVLLKAPNGIYTVNGIVVESGESGQSPTTIGIQRAFRQTPVPQGQQRAIAPGGAKPLPVVPVQPIAQPTPPALEAAAAGQAMEAATRQLLVQARVSQAEEQAFNDAIDLLELEYTPEEVEYILSQIEAKLGEDAPRSEIIKEIEDAINSEYSPFTAATTAPGADNTAGQALGARSAAPSAANIKQFIEARLGGSVPNLEVWDIPPDWMIQALREERATALGPNGQPLSYADALAMAGRIAGVTTPDGKIHLVATGLRNRTHAWAVFLHEATHKNGEFTAQYRFVVDSLAAWEKYPGDSVENQIWVAANARARQSRNYGQELVAYAVEEAVQRGIRPDATATGAVATWLRKVAQMFADLLTKITGKRINVEAYSANQLVALAQAWGNKEASGIAKSEEAIKFSFVGENSEEADLSALAEAQERTQRGEDREAILYDTGWTQFLDGKWRYEVSDDRAELIPKGRTFRDIMGNKVTSRVETILDHPELFAAYPELGKTVVKGGNIVGGSYQGPAGTRRGVITVGFNTQRKSVKSILLHELQHAIQDFEGFGRGGSAEEFIDDIRAANPNLPKAEISALAEQRYLNLLGEREARLVQGRRDYTDEFRTLVSPFADDPLLDTAEDIAQASGLRFSVNQGAASSYPPASAWYYSALQKTVDNLNIKNAPAESWITQLKASVGKNDLKNDELEWTGVLDWLKLQDGRISKEQVQTYIQGNGVQVIDDVRGYNPAQTLARDSTYLGKLRLALLPVVEEMAQDEGMSADAWLNRYVDKERELNPNQTQTNTEILENLLGELGEDLPSGRTKTQAELDADYAPPSYNSYTAPGAKSNYREVLLTFPPKDGKDVSVPTMASHWKNTKNVLAHIRLDDRVGSNGEKVLFVEEIQSDWGQTGRRKGFVGGGTGTPNEYEIVLLDFGFNIAIYENGDRGNPRFDTAYTADDRADAEARVEQLRQAETADRVTPGPFVTKTDSWLDLALKRVLAFAATEGYDNVAFINGQQMKNAVGGDLAGMQGFYDKLIPTRLKAVLKKIGGGGEVGEVGIATGSTAIPVSGIDVMDALGIPEEDQVDYWGGLTSAQRDAAMADYRAKISGPAPQLAVAITPGMREKIGVGLPLFSLANHDQPKTNQEFYDVLNGKGFPARPLSWTRARDWIATNFADTTRPFDVWARGFGTPTEQETLFMAKDRARSKKSALEKEVVDKFMRPLSAELSKVAKELGLGFDEAKEVVGRWMTVRYAVIKNAEYLKQDADALLDVQRVYATALANNQPVTAKMAQDIRDARDQLTKRQMAINDPNDALDPTMTAVAAGLAGGYNDATAKKIMADIEAKVPKAMLVAAAKPITDMLRWKLALDIRNGMTAASVAAKWAKAPEYVPLTGDPRNDESQSDVFGTGALNQSKNKKAVGRTSSLAVNGIDAAFEQMGKSANYHGWNDFKDQITKMYERLIRDEVSAGATPKEAVENVWEKAGIRREREGLTTDTAHSIIVRKGADVTKNGGGWAYTLNSTEAIEALQRANVQEQPSVLVAFAWGTKLLSSLLTRFMPGFTLIASLRDIPERAFNVAAKDLAAYPNVSMPKVAAEAAGHYSLFPQLLAVTQTVLRPNGTKLKLADTHPDVILLKEMLAEGGSSTTGGYLDRESQQLAESLGKLHGLPRASIDALRVWNDSVELIAPFSVYKALRKNGVDAKAAAGVTAGLMNFTRIGKWMQPLRALYMFSQPAVAGGQQMIQALSTKRGVGMFMGAILAATALYSMIRAGEDDEETGENRIDKLSKAVLERSIPIPLGDGKYLKIPTPFGALQWAWSIGSNLIQTTMGSKSALDAAGDIAAGAVKAISPVAPSEVNPFKNPFLWLVQTFTPDPATPITNVVTNRNFFGGEIAAETPRGQAAWKFARSSTPKEYVEASKFLLENTGANVSPEHLRELATGYGLGPIAEIRKALIDNPAKEERGQPTVPQVLDRYLAVQNEKQFRDRLFFEYTTELDPLRVKASDPKNASSLTPKEKQLVGLANAASDRAKSFGRMQAEARKMPDGEAKKARIKAIADQEAAYRLQFIKRYKELTK